MPHRFAGMTVRDILKLKKQSVTNAPLPQGAPDWRDVGRMTWEEIDAAAQCDLPGYRTIRKLLSDARFDK
jgi:hypothetical protein